MEEDKELLLKILEIDQSRISSLDSTRFTVKGWSITLVSALAGLTFNSSGNSSGNNCSPVLLGVGVVATVIFFFIDLSYRKVQLDHAHRSDYIQELLITKHRKEQEREHINSLLPIKAKTQQTQNFVKFIYQSLASAIKEIFSTFFAQEYLPIWLLYSIMVIVLVILISYCGNST